MLSNYKKATAYLSKLCQDQRRTIGKCWLTPDSLKKTSVNKEDDHKFFEAQIKKERNESTKLKTKIAESISEYEDFILGKRDL